MEDEWKYLKSSKLLTHNCQRFPNSRLTIAATFFVYGLHNMIIEPIGIRSDRKYEDEHKEKYTLS